MKIGHSIWAKHRQANEDIDLDDLFSDYWSSHENEFIVPSQSLSPTSPHKCSDREGQRLLPLKSIVAPQSYNSLQIVPFVPLPLARPSQLIPSA